MMRKVMVFLDDVYGASKTSDTEHTALAPVDLKVGAVGIYGISETSSNNAGKMALITEGGSDATGLVPDASFDGDRVFVNVGTTIGCQSSGALEPSGRVTYASKAYTAPVQQVITIALDPNDTIAKNESSSIRIVDTQNLDTAGVDGEWIDSSIATLASESDYSLAARHAEEFRTHPFQWVLAEVISVTAGAVFTTSATVAAVNGATSLTTSAAHGVGVGDYVRLGVDTYLAVTGTASTTLVLDKPFRGATATIANANTKDLGTTPGAISVKLTSLIVGKNYQVMVADVIENSTIVYTTAGTYGHGTSALVKEMEEAVLGYKGATSAATDAVMKQDKIHTVDGATYDVYIFKIVSVDNLSTGGNAKHAHNLYTELVVAFPSAGSSAGQSDFEKILAEVLFGTADLGGI